MALVITEKVNDVMIIGDMEVCISRVKGSHSIRVAISGQEKVIRGSLVSKVLIQHGWERTGQFQWTKDGKTASTKEAWDLCESQSSSDGCSTA